MASELFVVVGPNGSGKSSAIYETHIDESLIFVNPDDIARTDFAHIPDSNERNRLAWEACNSQRDMLLLEGVSFGFETVGSHPSKLEFLKYAKELGYKITLLFVATENPEINVRRIAERQKKGGHGVPNDKVYSRYKRTLALLEEYFEIADDAFVWDNSLEATGENDSGMRELVRKTQEGIELLSTAFQVNWVQKYLSSCF